MAFRHILASIAYLNHEEVYKAPYGWQIEVPAYITYMEPVVGVLHHGGNGLGTGCQISPADTGRCNSLYLC